MAVRTRGIRNLGAGLYGFWRQAVQILKKTSSRGIVATLDSSLLWFLGGSSRLVNNTSLGQGGGRREMAGDGKGRQGTPGDHESDVS